MSINGSGQVRMSKEESDNEQGRRVGEKLNGSTVDRQLPSQTELPRLFQLVGRQPRSLVHALV